MKKIALAFALLIGFQYSAFATEGMWIPSLIDMFYSDMKTYGLKLKASDIYATNKSSLKDAIVQFNGGCTAEIVSDQGLLLTNHHCGFSAIQTHSTLEKNYLRDGFWAKNHAEEIPCPWMYVTFVKEIRDVTKEVMKGVTDAMAKADRMAIIAKNIAELESKQKTNADISAKIKPFNQGNQYFMLVTEDFRDIRLVGTPPDAIGKYGGDTDNWVWPRHTGDFSVFRIYANKDNQPAAHSDDNKPFKPLHFFPVSTKDRKEGDFTMVYGFPGSTDQHYSSGKLKFYVDQERPSRIKMRTMTMDVMKPAMNESEEIRLKYASKQASIANAWKKWIGQVGGLKALNAVDKKLVWEKEYNEKAASKPEWKEKNGGIIDAMNNLQAEKQDIEFARAMFIEYFFYGPEFFRFAMGFNNLANSGESYEALDKQGKIEAEIKRLSDAAASFFKNYDLALDQKIFMAQTPVYLESVDEKLLPEGYKENWEKEAAAVYGESILLNPEKLKAFLADFNKDKCAQLLKDPALVLASKLYNLYINEINPSYQQFGFAEELLLQTYVEGILTMFPNKRTWADANSTLRITYGKIEGSAPHDGMKYTHFTTIDGIMQKHDPDNPDFELTDRFIELYNKKDFGNYTQDGKLWVCFTASNHTTGGNSGSPVIDANGNLIGINFDRSWESTMSDFMFDESRCRNIAVDMRYVLWCIDKYGGAKHLIDEMKLVK